MSNTTTETIQERLAGGYESACTILNITPATLDQFAFLPEDQRQALFSLHKIVTVIEAVNEGHVFDWNDYGEEKRYPIWDMETYNGEEAGSGFSLGVVYYVNSYSFVGARLVTRTREHAKFVAELMFEDYKHWIKK